MRAEKSRYQAVIFDLLTALLDSWTLWNRVAGSDEAGLRWRRVYLRLTYEAGAYRPYEEIIRAAAQAADIPGEAADRLIGSWGLLKPWPEASAVLDHLAARVPLGIATNCSDALAAIAVGTLQRPFAAVATAEAAGSYKPRPEPYRAALASLGVAPENALFVAGSAADVPGASAVGMTVFWHNRAGLPALDDARPAHTASTLTPLLDLV